MVLVTGGMQTVSKWTSQFSNDLDKMNGVSRQLFRLMFGLALMIGGGWFLAAPYIAEARGHGHLITAYRCAGIVLFAYAIYVVFVGILNGQKRFKEQALFDMGFTTLKATLILGLTAVGFGVTGAFYGFAGAALTIMLIAAFRVKLGSGGSSQSWSEVGGFAFQVMLYTLIFNLIFRNIK